MSGVPPAVSSAWGWRGDQITAYPGGLINATFVVRAGDGDGPPLAALQRLHPIWAPEVNLDIDAVTTHLAEQGMLTPRLLHTRTGKPWVEYNGGVWRALSWVFGETVHAVPDPEWARAAGELVGKFHRAVAELSYEYQFARAGVHDTAAHLEKLRAHVDAANGAGEAAVLGAEILRAAEVLPALPLVAKRHTHGDLKISNVLFRRDPLHAAALVDLDTLGKGTLAFELGDALRSWCNPKGEDEARARFELPIFAAAIAGFREVAGSLASRDELISIVHGLETVCLELASRFCVDAFEDRYFGWNPGKFPSRVAHNIVRARGQLALGLAVRAARAEALDVVLAGA